ncbi:hypothetical protein D6_0041 [Aeromonas phage D6]|uniref:Uncharacterized protein n=1 Tax=Aeromonas phage D6 TaxID=2593322 RepID=A0A514TW00_9CAUD|nr:hypothetical protein PQC08_gp234 [Aeromonas phage D6]QDJ97201.1 hypothetical protein D6_0041 [Aeromonas phage D6]
MQIMLNHFDYDTLIPVIQSVAGDDVPLTLETITQVLVQMSERVCDTTLTRCDLTEAELEFTDAMCLPLVKNEMLTAVRIFPERHQVVRYGNNLITFPTIIAEVYNDTRPDLRWGYC